MKKIVNGLNVLVLLAMVQGVSADALPGASVDPGFTIPSLAVVIGFLIKFLFFFAGLAALLYLLLGAFAWVTSSGDKENVKKAQDKIQAAVIGLVIIVTVVVLIATLEQVVLKGSFCIGLTCPIKIPALLTP